MSHFLRTNFGPRDFIQFLDWPYRALFFPFNARLLCPSSMISCYAYLFPSRPSLVNELRELWEIVRGGDHALPPSFFLSLVVQCFYSALWLLQYWQDSSSLLSFFHLLCCLSCVFLFCLVSFGPNCCFCCVILFPQILPIHHFLLVKLTCVCIPSLFLCVAPLNCFDLQVSLIYILLIWSVIPSSSLRDR